MKRTVQVLNIFLIVTFIVIPTFVSAKDEDKFNHRVAFNGALTSSDSWLLEFSYHYMFNRYVG